MKKILTQALFFLFVMGITMPAMAEMTYGPVALDDATVLSKKTFEIVGFYNGAPNNIEIESPPGDGGKTQITEVGLPVSALNASVSYGLSDIWEVGISRSKVSRDYMVSLSTATGTGVATTANISGWSDTMLKLKVGSGVASGALLVYLPNGKEGISAVDNDMDFGLKFALSPKANAYSPRFHLNLGLTKWGDKDNPKDQSSTFDYGMALELHWTNGYAAKTGGSWTMELAGNTQQNQDGNTPLDFYTGLKIDASEKFQFSALLALGLTDGSSISKWGLGYGIGFKWLIGS